MNVYEQKQAARQARYEAAADKASAKAQAAFRKGDMSEEATGIPFGQPILVGHHSEGRHRAAIKRADNAMRRGIAESDKAAHYAGKAASVGLGGISSDDPEAVDKLKAELATKEARQERMKSTNKAWRAYSKKPTAPATIKLLDALDPVSRGLAEQYVPEYSWQKGPFESYQMSNNNANIKRIRDRISTLEHNATREHKESEVNGIQVVENVEENRLQLIYPGKPREEIRKALKRNGFRFSPTNKAWQRQLNNAARWAAECVVKLGV